VNSAIESAVKRGALMCRIASLHIFVLLLLIAAPVSAADIGFGTIKGIKVYDYSAYKVIRIHFSDDATHRDEAACQGVAAITSSLHSSEAIQRMLAVALSAQTAGKKVRAYSNVAGSCEVEMLSVQDVYF
jgi:hypothetical protein